MSKTISVLLAISLSQISMLHLSGQDAVEELEEQAVMAAVDAVKSSVIQIETIGGLGRVDNVQTNDGPTTGLIVSEDGYAISSSFNFIQRPASIFARLPGGQRAAATIVARDDSRKLVLLKIESNEKFRAPIAARREKLAVGQTVIAVGKTYDSQIPNISVGILSATHRIWDKAVQTDAKISPANFGGPLVDLHGRVIGVLVPLSPDENDDIAGVEWYDSGIGFAVPLSDVLQRLEVLKQGKNLRSGLLGVTLKGSDIYSDPAEVVHCRGNSPAAKAGVRPGDVIVKFAGREIHRQAQLKHALGPLYEGDDVEIVVRRGKQSNPVFESYRVRLAGAIEPFRPPAIGILPSAANRPIAVRHVIDGSPAQAAGILPGDRLIKFNAQDVQSWDEVRRQIMRTELGHVVPVTIERGDTMLTLDVAVGEQRAVIPADLAPIVDVDPDAADLVDVVDVKVAELPNEAFALLPIRQLAESNAPGLLVWVSEPGKVDRPKQIRQWALFCARYNVAILVVQSADAGRWDRRETEFIVKAVDQLASSTATDVRKVAVGGPRAGGTMAALAAFGQRDLFRGLILIDAVLPKRLRDVTTTPAAPLLIFAGTSTDFERQNELDADVRRLRKAHFPIETESAGSNQLEWWSSKLAVWVDSLDRL